MIVSLQHRRIAVLASHNQREIPTPSGQRGLREAASTPTGTGASLPGHLPHAREPMQTWQVILLGLIEGLTEFIPVSSTGHLLLVGHFLGFESPGKTFEVLIQLGAILAMLSVYVGKLLHLLSTCRAMPARAALRAGGAGCLPAGRRRSAPSRTSSSRPCCSNRRG